MYMLNTRAFGTILKIICVKILFLVRSNVYMLYNLLGVCSLSSSFIEKLFINFMCVFANLANKSILVKFKEFSCNIYIFIHQKR